MSSFDRPLLAEKLRIVERHLDRVQAHVPEHAADLIAGTDRADVVVLHLWRAIEMACDVALAACVHFRAGTPASYAEAFTYLAECGKLDKALAARLSDATTFRDAVAHADDVDMTTVHEVARSACHDVPEFLRALAARL